MKLLQISAEQNDLFTKGFTLNLNTSDNVRKSKTDSDTFLQAYKLKPGLYNQTILAITGINATGKTTILEFIGYALHVIIGKERLNSPFIKNLLNKFLFNRDELSISIIFCDNFKNEKQNVYLLDSVVKKAYKENYRFIYGSEHLYSMPLSKFKPNQGIDQIKIFSNNNKLSKSRDDIKNDDFLLDDSSIVMSLKHLTCRFMSNLTRVNINTASFLGKPNQEFVECFDPGIEDLVISEYEGSYKASVTFKRGNNISLNSTLPLMNILSSGTIKGLNTIPMICSILSKGGYLLIDELENHFNKQIVRFIIELFTDAKTNPYGATLVFSTHYPELLDEITRKDNIYLTSRDVDNSLELTRFSDNPVANRNDLKKSSIVLYSLIAKTAPKKSTLIKAKNLIEKLIEQE